MTTIMAQAECYIKREENNIDKKAKDVDERNSNGSDSSQQKHRSHYTSIFREIKNFKCNGKPVDNFTPVNIRREKNWCEVLYVDNILSPLAPKTNTMRPKLHKWCKYKEHER